MSEFVGEYEVCYWVRCGSNMKTDATRESKKQKLCQNSFQKQRNDILKHPTVSTWAPRVAIGSRCCCTKSLALAGKRPAPRNAPAQGLTRDCARARTRIWSRSWSMGDLLYIFLSTSRSASRCALRVQYSDVYFDVFKVVFELFLWSEATKRT